MSTSPDHNGCLLVAATQAELDAFRLLWDGGAPITLRQGGVGILETAVNLTSFLAEQMGRSPFRAVINFGIAGGYPETGPNLLDICLADREVLGDLGLGYPERIERLDPLHAPPVEFPCDPRLLGQIQEILGSNGVKFFSGTFVTVSCVSVTERRGRQLARQYGAVCENMEGAALARICAGYRIPFMEIRVISNMVVDRAKQVWESARACRRAAEVVSLLLKELNCDRF